MATVYREEESTTARDTHNAAYLMKAGDTERERREGKSVRLIYFHDR